MRTRLIPLLPVLILPAAVAAQTPPPIYVAPVVPPALRLLDDPAVQKDVGLSADQSAAADKVRQGWSVPSREIHLGRFGRVPPEAFRVGANARTAEFLARGLTKAQRTRLDQILFQLREKEFGPHQALAMAARDLGLRSDQVEDVRNLKVLRVEAIDQTVTSGKRFEKIKLEVQVTNGDTYEKMAEMLTRAQRERLKELRGKPFGKQVEAAAPAAPLDKQPPARYPAPNGGYYDLELLYGVSPSIKSELKLSDAQVKGLSEAWEQATGGAGLATGRVPLGWVDLVHTNTEKALSTHLTKDQRARFDQIMMQRRARVSPEAVCTYPTAVTVLKLSPIQLQQLSSGKPLADVLSKDQLEKHAQLLGKPFDLPALKDDYLPKPVQAPPPAPITEVAYAQARDFLRLTDRLGLSAEQIKKLRELAEDEPKIRELIQKELSLEDTPPVAGSGRALTAEKAVGDHYREAVEQQCWDTLDPAQQSIARKIFGRRR
jgi:hypothetical protein